MKKLFLLVILLSTLTFAQGTYYYKVTYVECFNTATSQLLTTEPNPDLTIGFKLNSKSTGTMTFSTGLLFYLNSYKTLYDGAFEYKTKANNNTACITKLYFGGDGSLVVILIFNDLTFRYSAWVM